MDERYALTLHNRSSQPGFSFAAYVVPTVTSAVGQGTHASEVPSNGAFPIAGQAHRVNEGSTAHLSWTSAWSLLCGRQACRAGDVWRPASTQSVDLRLGSAAAYVLDYNGDYFFSCDARANVPPGHVELRTTRRVPRHDGTHGPSVGLGLDTGADTGSATGSTPTPVIVTDSGPNLVHRFGLSPTCYLWAGQGGEATQADPGDVRRLQKADFTYCAPDDAWSAEWTLNEHNQWVPGPP